MDITNMDKLDMAYINLYGWWNVIGAELQCDDVTYPLLRNDNG